MEIVISEYCITVYVILFRPYTCGLLRTILNYAIEKSYVRII